MAENPTAKTKNRPRPVSPHLQIYRLPLTALTSISHRASGLILGAGMIIQVAWLWAAATNAEYFAWWQGYFSSSFGRVCVFFWVFAMFYHMAAGIRHLVWDAGFGFEKASYRVTNWVVILGAAALALITFFAIYPKL